MVQFGKLFITFTMIGFFVFAMFSFISKAQLDNDVTDTILNDETINRTLGSLDSDLSAYKNKTQTQKGSFETEIPTAGFGSLLLFSIVSGGKVFTGMIVGVYNAIIVLPATILGISPVIVSIFTGLLLVSIVLGLWRLYKLGG